MRSRDLWNRVFFANASFQPCTNPFMSSFSPQQKYDFMTEKLHLTEKGSDPVVVMVLKSNGIINSVKNIIGLEDPSNAEGGTINGDYMFEGSRRIVEASEDLKEAEGDIKFWFTKEELVG